MVCGLLISVEIYTVFTRLHGNPGIPRHQLVLSYDLGCYLFPLAMVLANGTMLLRTSETANVFENHCSNS
jgi:hypothetical protein